MTQLSRRAFALSVPAATLAATSAGTMRPGPAAAGAGAAKAAMPLAQTTLGRFTITALADGYADMPFSYFTGRKPEEIEAAAASHSAARASGLRIMFTQYLVDDGERLVLIDAGPAGLIGKSGLLPQALANAGVSADRIGAVIVTHAHADHMGGLVAGGRRNFPNAEVIVDRRDVEHWTDPAKRAAAPEFLKSSFDTMSEVVRLYPRLQRVDGEREIARGISIMDLTGHTPGHIGVRISDGGQTLIMASDMMFHPSIHPASADIGFIFEQDPAAAQAMRARFFPRAAEEKAIVAATHMPFPGLGRVVPDRGQMRWVPAEWALAS